MPRYIAYALLLVAVLYVNPVMAGDAAKEKDAVSAAKVWLTMVDEGKYADSWQNTATYFRNTVPQSQWEQSLQAIRTPLGKVVSRRVNTKSYKTSLPGAPDGEYLVIQFTTSFANKKSSVETVTPMLENDGTWRVSGYFIK